MKKREIWTWRMSLPQAGGGRENATKLLRTSLAGQCARAFTVALQSVAATRLGRHVKPPVEHQLAPERGLQVSAVRLYTEHVSNIQCIFGNERDVAQFSSQLAPLSCSESCSRYCPRPAAASSSRQNRSRAAWLSASGCRTAAALAARLAASARVYAPARGETFGSEVMKGNREPQLQTAS